MALLFAAIITSLGWDCRIRQVGEQGYARIRRKVRRQDSCRPASRARPAARVTRMLVTQILTCILPNSKMLQNHPLDFLKSHFRRASLPGSKFL